MAATHQGMGDMLDGSGGQGAAVQGSSGATDLVGLSRAAAMASMRAANPRPAQSITPGWPPCICLPSLCQMATRGRACARVSLSLPDAACPQRRPMQPISRCARLLAFALPLGSPQIDRLGSQLPAGSQTGTSQRLPEQAE